MVRKSLNGTWKMRQKDQSTWQEITIPGSVLSGLLEQEAIKDPYYGTNEYETRELLRNDYEFITEFSLNDCILMEVNIDFVCYGIDTLADIYLNGIQIISINNMHRTYRISCKEYLKSENELRVYFHSPITYIDAYQGEKGKEITYIPSGAMNGNQYLRKAHSMFGWDWGAQLPDMGIFRDISIEAYSDVRLIDSKFIQLHKETFVDLDIVTDFDYNLNKVKEYEFGIQIFEPKGTMIANRIQPFPQVDFREYESEFFTCKNHKSADDNIVKENTINKTKGSLTVSVIINEPQLWWPNGLGEQPLYKVKLIIKNKVTKKICDEKEYRIGLRTLTVSQEEDDWGTEFAFKVNGVKIFAKGANYIPEDCIYSTITKDRIEYLLNSSVRANFNCIRVWGGGYYPSDAFYDLCDEYGLIVWQDLMFACNIYDVTEDFASNIIQEVRDNVIRLRHHASLGLWCGNNEIESAWHNWGNFKEHSARLKADYIKQFEYILPRTVSEYDSQTFYWPSSPSSGGCFDDPDDDNRGDKHYWEVWHGQKPFNEYQNHFFRFCSEFGFQSFPDKKTIETYTEELDRNIFSEVMESHQKNEAANGKILHYISENFLYPKDFNQLVYVSQLLQGIAIKSGVEHWRRNRGRCMGSLYWQLNDNWPVASWASIDYYGRWKALHYMAKNFYAQVAGSIVRTDNVVSAYATNENLYSTMVHVRLKLKNMHLEVLNEQEFSICLEEQSSKLIAAVDYSKWLEKSKKEVFVEAIFTYEDGRKTVECEIFVPYKYLNLVKPDLNIDIREEKECFTILLTANCFVPFVVLDLKEMDVIWGDNYFFLTESIPKEIQLHKRDIVQYAGGNKKLDSSYYKKKEIKDESIIEENIVEGNIIEGNITQESLRRQLVVQSLYNSYR